MRDVVIVDNSVYSFAFQIDNGIPIIPFYNDKADEEMLHLVYYLNCLAGVDDVREQNRQAFELFKLSNGENLDQGDSESFTNGGEQDKNYFTGDNDPTDMDSPEQDNYQQSDFDTDPYQNSNGHNMVNMNELQNQEPQDQMFHGVHVNDIIHEESKE